MKGLPIFRGARPLVAALVLAAAVSPLAGCSEQPQQLEWPTSGLSTVLPEPDSTFGEINSDGETRFSADIEQVTANDYRAYRDQCKEAGFTIDSNSTDSSYTAFNEDGYELRISFYESMEEFDINLEAPREFEEIAWPTMGMATLLPKPESATGSIDADSSSELIAYLADTPKEAYDAYVDACITAGFDADYRRGDDLYEAEDAQGNSLTLSYEGFDTMRISLRAPDEDKTDGHDEMQVITEEPEDEAGDAGELVADEAPAQTSDSGSPETSRQESQQDIQHDATQPEEPADEQAETEASAEAPETAEDTAGAVEAVAGAVTDVIGGDVTPEFKATMDSYEAFFDEYVEFMNNYQDSNDVVGMLTQYSEMMTRYAETMEALGEVDTASLSAADLAYYTEVTARITQKLATIGQ